MDDLTPSAPAGYSLVSKIGRGASSVVWEARRLADGRPVALKILEADVSDPDAARRFEREREAMTALARHPHIVTIVDAGVQGGRPWLAMELCRRGSLAAYVTDGGALDLATALRVVDRLASALAVAHDAGVVHCDVKPANIMLTDAGEPSLGDFGIARVSVGRATTTTVGGFSLDHVAPELLDDGKRSPRSDVYSLGTTTWELLVGHPPFRQTSDVSVGAVLTRILRQPLPESSRVPAEVLDLLRRMAAKTPEERPASMREVGDEVRALADRLGIVLDERVLPALSAAQAEVFTAFPAGVDLSLGAEDTHRRLYVRPDLTGKKSTRSSHRRVPFAAAASLVTVLAIAGAAVGVYGMVTTPTPTPAPVAQLESVAPAPPPTTPETTVTTAPTSSEMEVEEPPPPTRERSTTTRRTTARRAAPPPPPPPTTTQPPPEPTSEPVTTSEEEVTTDPEVTTEVGTTAVLGSFAEVPVIRIQPTTALPRGRIIPGGAR